MDLERGKISPLLAHQEKSRFVVSELAIWHAPSVVLRTVFWRSGRTRLVLKDTLQRFFSRCLDALTSAGTFIRRLLRESTTDRVGCR